MAERQIRVWRVDEGYSWRGVASAATVEWATHEETNQRIIGGIRGTDQLPFGALMTLVTWVFY